MFIYILVFVITSYINDEVLCEKYVSDEEYLLMPPLFHLDDFDRCMSLGENSLYCYITVQLAPVESRNYSNVWRIIQEIISHEKNYRHDRLRHGICVSEFCPEVIENVSTYKHDDQILKSLLSKCYSNKYGSSNLTGVVTKMHCETTDPFYAIDVYDISVGVAFIILFTIVIFSSFYEGIARYETKEKYDAITTTTFGKIASSFSIPKNWNRLRSNNTSPEAISLRCINGARFYSMSSVIMVHVCMIAFAGPVSNPQFAEKVTDNPFNMIVVNGAFLIQCFLVVSGWLLSYYFFSAFEGHKNVKFSYIIIAVIYRYIRLTPCLLVMIAFSSTWLYHLNRGPLWDKLVGEEYRNCRANWWTNLLYINNYYNSEKMCLQQTWYLAADMQLFLLTLIITIFMWKYQRHIKSILGICLFIAILIPGIINYIYDYDIVVRHYPEPLYNILLENPQWHKMYASGYTNIGSAMIGLTFGYIFYKYRDQRIITKKIYVALWWILIFGLPFGVVFIGIPIYSENYVHSRLLAAVHVSLARNLVSLGIGLGLFGITQGIGWFLRDLFVWSPLTVLGRLTYCAYLVHVTHMRVQAGQARSMFYMSNYSFLSNTCGDIAVAYMYATVLCLFVEMPTSALQKLLLPQLQRK